MQVEVKNVKQPEPVDEDFRGLVVDRDGEFWLKIEDGLVLLHEQSTLDYCPYEETVKAYGPFTEFDGELILRN